MTKLIVVIATAAVLCFQGCAEIQSLGVSETAMKQAFGDAIRSLENSGLTKQQIPDAIRALAAKWLPKTGYTDFVNNIITDFLANASTDQTNKLLESIAGKLNTSG